MKNVVGTLVRAEADLFGVSRRREREERERRGRLKRRDRRPPCNRMCGEWRGGARTTARSVRAAHTGNSGRRDGRRALSACLSSDRPPPRGSSAASGTPSVASSRAQRPAAGSGRGISSPGAPTLDGPARRPCARRVSSRSARRRARRVRLDPIEDALHAARYGAVVVPIPADADALATSGPFADALARIRAAAASAAPPTERVPYAPPPLRPAPGRALLAGRGAGPLFAAFVASRHRAFWAAAPAALVRIAKRFDAAGVSHRRTSRAPEDRLGRDALEPGWSLMLHLRRSGEAHRGIA